MRMRSQELNRSIYNTDKDANYLNTYDHLFAGLIDEPVTLLELGIFQGGSLLLWNDYFSKGTIVGIDLQIPDIGFPERVHAIQCDQTDKEKLTKIAKTFAPDGFDVIIDDASHIGKLTKISFWHLFHHHLKTGGYYIIEDWGTGYWDDWADGKSMNLDGHNEKDDKFPYHYQTQEIKKPMKNHSYGMVGFIKQLVDEMGAGDATKKLVTTPSTRPSKFESIAIYPGLFVVKKARFDFFGWEQQLEKAFQYQRDGQIDNAIDNYQNIILQKEDSRAYLGLAECYGSQANYVAALENLKKGIAINPNNPDLYTFLGKILIKMGRKDEANKYFSLAQSIKENK